MNALRRCFCNLQDLGAALLITVVVLTIVSAQGYGQAKDASTALPQVEIAGTQLVTLNSSIGHQEYVLHVNLPRGYDDTTKTFPVQCFM